MSRAPRVLVSGVLLSQPMGGVRRHNQELLPRAARLLNQRGGSLVIMTGAGGLPFDVPGAELAPSSTPWRPPLVRATLEGRGLRKHLEANRAAATPIDLVHTAHLPVPRRLPVPYALTVHDLRSLAGAHTPMSRRLIARKVVGEAVERATAVITVSEAVKKDLLARFRLDPARVRVVPNAGDHFTPLPRAPGPTAPILYVGHLEPRKNLALLLHALAADAKLPPLLLAGAPKHAEDERLAAEARRLGLAERVRFHGPFDDAELPRLYAEAACLVLPSTLEGFGIPILEAQLAGVPVAISRTEALREVAGANAPSFAPDDPAECARALAAALAATPTELAAARESAARFSWNRSADALVEAWQVGGDHGA